MACWFPCCYCFGCWLHCREQPSSTTERRLVACYAGECHCLIGTDANPSKKHWKMARAGACCRFMLLVWSFQPISHYHSSWWSITIQYWTLLRVGHYVPWSVITIHCCPLLSISINMMNHYYPLLAVVSSALVSCAGLGSGAGACSAELCVGLAAGMARVIQLVLVAIRIWDWESHSETDLLVETWWSMKQTIHVWLTMLTNIWVMLMVNMVLTPNSNHLINHIGMVNMDFPIFIMYG